MAKTDRKKFGVTKTPLSATRLLGRKLDHFQDNDIDAHALLVINEEDGTVTAANVYDGNLGKNFVAQPFPLPAENDEKWKEYTRRGYREYDLSDFDCLAVVGEEAEVEVEA